MDVCRIIRCMLYVDESEVEDFGNRTCRLKVCLKVSTNNPQGTCTLLAEKKNLFLISFWLHGCCCRPVKDKLNHESQVENRTQCRDLSDLLLIKSGRKNTLTGEKCTCKGINKRGNATTIHKVIMY